MHRRQEVGKEEEDQLREGGQERDDVWRGKEGRKEGLKGGRKQLERVAYREGGRGMWEGARKEVGGRVEKETTGHCFRMINGTSQGYAGSDDSVMLLWQ